VDVRELRYFVALAEERHFGRAAERLYIAQSGLSRAIRRAEDELGIALFARNRRHVELTEAGAALLERAYGVLSDFEEVQAIAEAARGGLVGTLSLAISPAARYGVVPELLRDFADAFPDVRIVRREQLGAAIAEELLAGTLDLGIACGAPEREGLRRERLSRRELRLLVPVGDPLCGAGRGVALPRLGAGRLLLDAELAELGSAACATQGMALAPQPAPCPAPATALVRNAVVVDYDEGLRRVLRDEGALLSARTFLGGAPRGVSALGLDPPLTMALELVARAGEPTPVVTRFADLARRVTARQQHDAAAG
jgi:DNA-binding transcriptional LysR family regulator